MKVSKINSANTNIQSFKGIEQDTKTAPKEVKDGKKKLALTLTALGVAATAGVVVYKISKGKTVKLSDIKFDKGVASLKDSGKKFTGKIKDVLKNGDQIILEYKNGEIKNSTKKGSTLLQKFYDTAFCDGSGKYGGKFVTIIENGREHYVNISDTFKKGKIAPKSGSPIAHNGFKSLSIENWN